MTQVTIVGGGMAGLSAALRLAGRGFEVTVFEQARHVGGQFGVIQTEDGRLHEHCYHMFLNWYNNFWDIVDELGVRDNFVPRSSIQFLERGKWPETTRLTDVGSPKTNLQNMMSGVLPVPDMFIYGYALIDLLSQPFNRDRYRDQYSVNGFMASRGYATDRAAREFQRSLAKAFACPPYRTSAVSYKTFLKYGFRHPEPMMWVLEGDCYNHFLKHLVARLADLGCTVKLACEVKAIELDDQGVA
ncbi:MAG: FAD-dependent oxidoreductase, partial [Gammaproteobacteria bacterium]